MRRLPSGWVGPSRGPTEGSDPSPEYAKHGALLQEGEGIQREGGLGGKILMLDHTGNTNRGR